MWGGAVPTGMNWLYWDYMKCVCFTETIGQAGLQLFIDTGVPVDDTLVNDLVKEVILEKVHGMMGQQLQEAWEAKPPSPKPRPRSTSKAVITPRHNTVSEVCSTFICFLDWLYTLVMVSYEEVPTIASYTMIYQQTSETLCLSKVSKVLT